MNKKPWIWVCLLMLLPFSAQAGVFKTAGSIVKTVFSQVRVESPALRQFGFSFEGHDMVVVNGTPFFAEITVYETTVAVLGPGDVAYDDRHFEPLTPQVPIVARFYRVYDGETLSSYMGVATNMFTISSGVENAQSWIIRASEIRALDGIYLDATTYPAPNTEIKSAKKAFPRKAWNATSVVQLVNNTRFDARVLVDGRDKLTLHPGDLGILTAKNLAVRGLNATIQLVFTDRGRLEGTWETQYFIPSEGVIALQFIVSSYDIRRY